MPRGPVVYTLPPGTTPQSPGDLIQSAVWNAAMDDVAQTFNTILPEAYGGTASATFSGAFANIVRPNIVGTVSQTGGAPTGAIVEEGSNGNGTYLKLASGFMMCTQTFTLSTASARVWVNSSWTFPVAFAATPKMHVTIGVPVSNQIVVASGNGSNVTTGVVYLNSETPVSSQTLIATAIGNWF